MSTETPTQTEIAEWQEIDTNSKKGWDRFTKFLLGNVIATIAALLVVGLLTVWR